MISLPRHAPIEWWSLGIANIASPSSRASFTSRSFPWGAVANLVVAARHKEDPRAPSRVSFVLIVFSKGATAGNLPSFDRIMDDMELVGKSNVCGSPRFRPRYDCSCLLDAVYKRPKSLAHWVLTHLPPSYLVAAFGDPYRLRMRTCTGDHCSPWMLLFYCGLTNSQNLTHASQSRRTV